MSKEQSGIGSARAGRWCILRTGAARTLPLARSLNEAGIEAWTPTLTITWRRPRGGPSGERDAPILPSFVFARADHVPALLALRAQPVNGHPPFMVFRHDGRIPLLGEGQMATLRAEEARAAAERQAAKDREAADIARKERRIAMEAEHSAKRERIAEQRASAPAFAIGTKVSASHGAFGGMTGVVAGRKGHSAVINFGGSMTFTIEAWHLEAANI